MTKSEPVALFSGAAAVVGLAVEALLPDVVIPDEALVILVAAVAGAARWWAVPLDKHLGHVKAAAAIAANLRKALEEKSAAKPGS